MSIFLSGPVVEQNWKVFLFLNELTCFGTSLKVERFFFCICLARSDEEFMQIQQIIFCIGRNDVFSGIENKSIIFAVRCFHLFLTCILSFAAKESGKINFSSYHVCFISPYQVSFLLDVSLSFIPIFYLPLKSEIHSSIMLLFSRIFLISSIFLLPLFVFLAHIVLFILFIFTLSFSNLCELYYKLSPLGLYTSSFF